LWRGIEAVSFLGGLWIGAVLSPIPRAGSGRPVSAAGTSPLKEMSYAIQASPWRPWPQMSALAVLVVWSLVLIPTG
jgi:hypothetical protein